MITRSGFVRGLGSLVPAAAVAALPLRTRADTPAAIPDPGIAAFAAADAIQVPTLSPDGKKVAYSFSNAAGAPEIMIVDLETRQRQRLAVDGDNKLRGLLFEGDEVLLVTISDFNNYYGETFEQSETFAVTLDTGRFRRLRPSTDRTGMIYSYGWVASMLPEEPGAVVYATTELDDREPRMVLYKVDIRSNRTTTVALGNTQTYDWLVDASGTPKARADFDDKNMITTVHVPEEAGLGRWKEIFRVEGTAVRALSLVALRDANRAVVLLGFDDSEGETPDPKRSTDFGEVSLLNLQTGQLSTMARMEDTELDDVITDPWTGRVIGFALGGLVPKTAWIDPQITQIQADLEASFPDQTISILNFSRDRNRVLFAAAALGKPYTYMVYDQTARQLIRLGPARSDLQASSLGQVTATTFKARDGADIPVYITLPPGVTEARNLPAVVFPHGGPAERDFPSFDWWAQFMATRGYVVIQPQFRGSVGFGFDHAARGRQQWGRRMQDDVTDSVTWAAGQGMIDSRRVAIVGSSYGGYAALAGATLTPDLYRCAISVSGVTDLPAWLENARREADRRSEETLNYWRTHIGETAGVDLIAVSPARQAERVTIPVLLLHASEDTIVPFDQSRRMEQALQRAGKPVRLVALRGEDHWLSRNETREQLLQEIEGFLRENLEA